MQFKNEVFCLFIQFLGQFIKIDGHFFPAECPYLPYITCFYMV